MKYTLIAATLLMSLSAFAQQLGEGAKPGCNPSEWSCDRRCQELKARECGVALSDLRGGKSDLNAPQKPRARGKRGSEQ